MPLTAQDRFPQTRRTWILRTLEEGGHGRLAVNRHVLEVYAQPLEVYFRGSSLRYRGEPTDAVHGFLAWCLDRPIYFQRWEASGLPLRRWLINGLHFYLKPPKPRRSGLVPLEDREHDLYDAQVEPDRALLEEYRQAYIRSIVEQALRVAQEQCENRNLSQHWACFLLHYCREFPYADVAAELQAGIQEVRSMAKVARKWFRRAVREVLVRDGNEFHQVDKEIRELLEDAQ